MKIAKRAGKVDKSFPSFPTCENLISSYEPIIELDFNDLFTLCFQGIYHRLGDVFMRLKKWSEAERFHRAALDAEPNHIGAHISFGTMLARNVSIVS